MAGPAFVSVVTPVYNGGKFLNECIESVRAQSYTALEHVIVDNASTDDTPTIAARHARSDGRIRVHRNDRTLSMVDNWNRTVEMMSPDAAYCWLLPADDMMYPQALERMVELARRHPTVGIVGSLRRRGDIVECDGLPKEREVFSGREIGRLFLEQRVYAIAPTTNLMRADLVRARRPFYPSRYFHEDIAAFIELLRVCDFGFVHDVLAFSRPHEGSMTATVARPEGTTVRDYLRMLLEYGPDYFGAAELARIERRRLRAYYRLLLRSYVTPGGGEFRRRHMAVLREVGRAPGPIGFGMAVAEKAFGRLARPR